MSRQPKNEAFARTSFLQGANAAYIEEMQAQYERNPGSVSDEWRHFFASLQEEQRAERRQRSTTGRRGPGRSEQLEQQGDRELLGRADRRLRRSRAHIRDKLQAARQRGGLRDDARRPRCAPPRTASAR